MNIDSRYDRLPGKLHSTVTTMINEETTKWTPLPRPCLVCLTKKKVNHNNVLLLRAADMPHVDEERAQQAYEVSVQSRADKVEKFGIRQDDRRKSLSLKRAANFADQSNVVVTSQKQCFPKMSAKKVCKEKPVLKLNTNQGGPMEQVFGPAVKEQFNKSSTANTLTQPDQRSCLQSSSSVRLSNKTQTVLNFTKQKITPKQTATQSISNQPLDKNESCFQKSTISSQSGANNITSLVSDDELTTDGALTVCPLCQMAFSPSLAQIQKDGHIAMCLSEASEDVIW
ncbi:uncharacterized protein LOC117101851 [Anneissia japonica]|uniref:uncharacterized protein LOC117101851 n=1 Tax=Anneissia japonica TaxID=1529436 RepID=UPI00142574EE|nr:uncharacterized protein LOC117101851 [Anneissia japonica]